MNALRDAVALQQRAVGDLQRTRDGAAAWADEQRHKLDRQCLDPLLREGNELLRALQKAADELAAARRTAVM